MGLLFFVLSQVATTRKISLTLRRTLRNPVFISKIPVAPCDTSKHTFRTLRNLVSVPKRPVATCETSFQNHLALSHIATVVFKIIWGCNDSFRLFLMQLLIVWHVKQLPVIAVVTFELNCGCCIAG